MAQNQKSYDNEFKAQAVKLAQEIGGHAMTMPDVKACGHASKRNYFMGVMTPPQ